MFKASFFSRQAAAPHPGRPQPNGWFRVQHSWILGVAALQSACSLLIEVDDGLEEVEVGHSQGGSTSEGPDASAPDATAGSSGSGGTEGPTAAGGSSGSGASEPDAGVPEPDGGDGSSEKQP